MNTKALRPLLIAPQGPSERLEAGLMFDYLNSTYRRFLGPLQGGSGPLGVRAQGPPSKRGRLSLLQAACPQVGLFRIMLCLNLPPVFPPLGQVGLPLLGHHH